MRETVEKSWSFNLPGSYTLTVSLNAESHLVSNSPEHFVI